MNINNITAREGSQSGVCTVVIMHPGRMAIRELPPLPLVARAFARVPLVAQHGLTWPHRPQLRGAFDASWLLWATPLPPSVTDPVEGLVFFPQLRKTSMCSVQDILPEQTLLQPFVNGQALQLRELLPEFVASSILTLTTWKQGSCRLKAWSTKPCLAPHPLPSSRPNQTHEL